MKISSKSSVKYPLSLTQSIIIEPMIFSSIDNEDNSSCRLSDSWRLSVFLWYLRISSGSLFWYFLKLHNHNLTQFHHPFQVEDSLRSNYQFLFQDHSY